MYVYKRKGKLLEKYEVVSVDREALFQVRRFWSKFLGGKFFNAELSTLVQKVLDGDNTAVLKVLNMQMPGMFEAKLKGCFELRFSDENMELDDYFRACKFFGIRLPQAPIKTEPDMLYNGFFYFKLGEKLVKYGVKFDIERLVNIRTHILATCRTVEKPALVKMIDKLLQGNYAVTPDLLKMIKDESGCPFGPSAKPCTDKSCKEYFRALRDTIKIDEFVVIDSELFNSAVRFFNIDCPEDYVPVSPEIQYERGAYAYAGRARANAEVEAIKKMIAEAPDEAQRAYWEDMLAQITPTFEDEDDLGVQEEPGKELRAKSIDEWLREKGYGKGGRSK